MSERKKQDVQIKIALIGAGGVILAAFVYGIGAELFKERPIIDVSLGGLTTNYPNSTLQLGPNNNYFIDVIFRNRGIDDGMIDLTVEGTNATIWSSISKTWDTKQTETFQLFGDDKTAQPYKIFVKPNPNANIFSVDVLPQPGPRAEFFQQINTLRPMQLSYQKLNGAYQLVP